MGTTACKEVDVKEVPTKIKNQKILGKGGVLDLPAGSKAHVCVVAYDYHGYGADAQALPRLSAVRDGARFARFAMDCGAEVREYYDRKELYQTKSGGFPTKQVVLDEWRRIGREMEPSNEVFVFYFAGHGLSAPRELEEGSDEMMVFMEPDGTPAPMTDVEVAMVLAEAFPPTAHILFITDFFNSGTLCDLSRPQLAGRPIVHLAAVKDRRHLPAAPKGKGPMEEVSSAFTQELLDTVESLVQVPIADDDGAVPEDFSVVQVYNKVLENYSSRFEAPQDVVTEDLAKKEMPFDGQPAEEAAGKAPEAEGSTGKSPGSKQDQQQDLSFELTPKFDPDTFRWPLMPPPGWLMYDPLEQKKKQSLGIFACMG